MLLLKNDILTRVILNLGIFVLILMLPWWLSVAAIILATALISYFFEGIAAAILYLSMLDMLNSLWAIGFIIVLIVIVWIRAGITSKYMKI
jgi:hypothetical protein